MSWMPRATSFDRERRPDVGSRREKDVPGVGVRAIAGVRSTTPGDVRALQRFVGNRATVMVLQRTVETAVEDLYGRKEKKLPKEKTKTREAFLKKHDITEEKLAEVQQKLDERWEQKRAQAEAEQVRTPFAQAMKEKSGVGINEGGQGGVEAWLDIDQLKHQHKDNPIGTRQKGGGNKFSDRGTADWHRANTLKYMAQWAKDVKMTENPFPHGQGTSVNGIHYEGRCFQVGGKRYVFFHCYPDNDNNGKLPKK
jgi:hypothetical protein